MTHIFPSGEEEVNHNDKDHADHNAKDTAAAADDNINDNDEDNDGTILPHKVKPVATAATKTFLKKPKKDDEIMHLPAPKLPKILNFSIKAEDPLTVSYYANGHDYADVVFHVNGTMEYGEYKVRVAKDGRSILFVCAIRARSFGKKNLKNVMNGNYHKSCTCIIAWDDTVQEMEAKKAHFKHGLFWGEPQVAYLRWKCTGTPIAINKHVYATNYHVKI